MSDRGPKPVVLTVEEVACHRRIGRNEEPARVAWVEYDALLDSHECLRTRLAAAESGVNQVIESLRAELTDERCAGCHGKVPTGKQSWCGTDCVCLGAVWCIVCWNRHIDRRESAGPTQHAYDQACKALRERQELVKAAFLAAQAYLDSVATYRIGKERSGTTPERDPCKRCGSTTWTTLTMRGGTSATCNDCPDALESK